MLALATLLLVAAELSLRVGTARGWASWNSPMVAASEGYLPPPHVFDAQVGYRYRPHHRGRFVRADFDNLLVTNNFGFRGPDFELRKRAGTYRLALLGDSLLSANQVPVEATWAALLEARLAPLDGRRVEVLNFGVDGYRAWNTARLLEATVLDFQPDAVVVWADEAVLQNPYELYRTTARGRILASYQPDLLLAAARRESAAGTVLGAQLVQHSHLARWLVRATGKRVVPEPNYEMLPGTSPRVHALEDLLGGMLRACRARGAAFAVFYRNRRPGSERDAAARLGIPVATDAGPFPTYAGLTFSHDGHFDPAGHARYVRVVAPLFDELLARLEAGRAGRATQQAAAR